MCSKSNLIYATITFLLLITLAACSDNSTTGGDDDPNQATINGTVEGESSKSRPDQAAKSTEGTVVYAATITSNNSVETIEGTETEVDASGEFSLDVDAGIADEIAIVAENEEDTLYGFISADLENGTSYTVKPLNVESSSETEVFLEVKSGGNSDIIHKSDIESVISASTASEVYGNNSATSEIAAGVTNSAEARVEFFEEFSEEDAQTNLTGYFEIMTDAQFDYETALYETSSNDEKEAAFESYLEAKINAFMDSGLEEKETAELLHLQGTVMLNSITSASSEVKNDIRKSSSFQIGLAIDHAVQAKAEASGMSEGTISAIADAGSTLRSEVQGSDGSESSIEAAFETYHEEVLTAIGNDSSVEGSAVVTIDTEINTANGAKFTFDSALSGLIDASQVTDTYIEFEDSVRTVVEANSALTGDIDADLFSDIMVLINLSS